MRVLPEARLALTKKLFVVLVENPTEYIYDFCPDLNALKPQLQGVDVLSFRERSWCNEFGNIPFTVKICRDNVAVAEFNNYMEWLQNLKSETRARIRRATKRGLTVQEVVYSEEFAYGVWRIFNESSVRQGRKFIHYGMDLPAIKYWLSNSVNLFLGAYHGKELVGLIELALGDCTGQVCQFLSLERKRDLLPNNALIAKAVEVCTLHGINWLVYARMGNHPSLDDFKRNNGFRKVNIKRFFVPLTYKGKLFLALGLHRSFRDAIPVFLKPLGFRVYNFGSKIYLLTRRLRDGIARYCTIKNP